MKKPLYYFFHLGRVLCIVLLFYSSGVNAQKPKESKESIVSNDLIEIEDNAQKKAKKEIESYYLYNYKELKLNFELMSTLDYRNLKRLNNDIWNDFKLELKNNYNSNYIKFLAENRMDLEIYVQKIADGVSVAVQKVKLSN